MRKRAAALAGAALSVLILGLSGCATAAATATRHMPDHLVPASIGAITFKREPAAEKAYRQAGPTALVSEGRVYTVRWADVTAGSVQVSLFKPKVDTSDLADSMSDYCIENPDQCTGHEAFLGIEASLGNGRFHRVYYKDAKAYEMALSDSGESAYVWFPPRTEAVVIMVLLDAPFGAGDEENLFHALLDYQHGLTPAPIATPSPQLVAPVGATPAGFGPSPGLPDLFASPSPRASPAPSANPSPGGSPTP